MKSKQVPLEQFSFETKYLDGDNEEILEIISSHVGHMVFEFNLLEERLTAFICLMINYGSDARGLIVTHDLNYSSKIELFNRLSQNTQNICQKKIQAHEKLIEDLKECGRLRNIVIHAEWNTIDLQGYAFVKLRIKKNDIIQEFIQLDEDSLIRIRNLIIETYNSFDNYDEAYGEIVAI